MLTSLYKLALPAVIARASANNLHSDTLIGVQLGRERHNELIIRVDCIIYGLISEYILYIFDIGLSLQYGPGFCCLLQGKTIDRKNWPSPQATLSTSVQYDSVEKYVNVLSKRGIANDCEVQVL